MDTLQLLTFLTRIALAVVFAAAAIGKLRDLDASRAAASDLGVGHRWAPLTGTALPWVELAVATCLVVTAIATWAAIVALALLTVFSALVARSLRLGRRPACNCFGAGQGAPIGAATLVRNGMIAAAAGAVAARGLHGGPAALGAVGDLTGGQAAAVVGGAVAAAVIGTQAWLVTNLLRQHGRVLVRLAELEHRVLGTPLPDRHGSHDHRHHDHTHHGHAHHGHAHHDHDRDAAAGPRRTARPGPAIGAPAHRFALDDIAGRRVSIDDVLDDGRPQVLLFLEVGCPACEAMASTINDAADGSDDPDRAIVAIVRGDRTSVLSAFDPAGFRHLLVDETGEVAGRYGVVGTPSAIVVLPDGRTASALAEGRAAAHRLVRRDAHHDARRDVHRDVHHAAHHELQETSR